MMIMHAPALFEELCRRRGITQNAVARGVNLSPSFLSQVHSGKRRINEHDADAIAKLLRVRTARLFAAAAPPIRYPGKEAQRWGLDDFVGVDAITAGSRQPSSTS